MPALLIAFLSVPLPSATCVSISLSFSFLSCLLYLLGLAAGASDTARPDSAAAFRRRGDLFFLAADRRPALRAQQLTRCYSRQPSAIPSLVITCFLLSAPQSQRNHQIPALQIVDGPPVLASHGACSAVVPVGHCTAHQLRMWVVAMLTAPPSCSVKAGGVCDKSQYGMLGVAPRAGVKPLNRRLLDEQNCHECPRRAAVL